MIAVDSNILIYAHREDSPHQGRAWTAVQSLAEGPSPWAIPWPCVHEFLAVVTNPRAFKTPTPMPRALDAMQAWIDSPSLVLLSEGDAHWGSLCETLLAGGLVGGQVHDARIYALCLQHRVREFWTADSDFRNFAGVPVRNPLLDREG